MKKQNKGTWQNYPENSGKQPIVEGLPELLKKIYHEIDICCISETDHVTMEIVRNILVKHGANEPDLW